MMVVAIDGPVASGEMITSDDGRYLQYRAVFVGGETQQGSLDSINICYCP